MKYKIKQDVWLDTVTGQRYTRDYAFRNVVSFNENGNIIRGYVYSPYGVSEDVDQFDQFRREDLKFGFPAYCFGQKLFLTDSQVDERFQYLGKLEKEEDIDESIKYYEQEDCDFNNLEWLAKLTLRDLKHQSSEGLSQCVHAKLLEFLFSHAPKSEKMEELKKQYFQN